MSLPKVAATELSALVDPAIDSTPDVIDSVALARLYGAPLFALPPHLYIPPDALEVFLETFQGSLDFLLYLTRKQTFNVHDLPLPRFPLHYLPLLAHIPTQTMDPKL